MPETDQAAELKLLVPSHVRDVLTAWALNELDEEPEAVAEAVAYELCQNAELRAYAAGLVAG